MNEAGYGLLGDGKIEDAVRLFELNAEEFPADPNVFDSLAEAYARRGDKELAVRFYRKSLSMDPSNANAVEMLKGLGAM